MAKNEGSSNKKLYWGIGIGIAVVVLIIVVLIVILALSGNNGGDNLREFNTVEADFLATYDKYVVEYNIAIEENTRSEAALSRSMEALNKAQSYIAILRQNVSQMQSLAAQAKAKESGDALTWWENVDNCYKLQSQMLDLDQALLDNELKYFEYSNHTSSFDRSYEEMLNVLEEMMVYAGAGDEQKVIDAINRVKSKLPGMKEDMQGAYGAIGLEYLKKYIQWTEVYDEAMDFSLQGLETQSYNKGVEAGKILNSITESEKASQFDAWYIPNISDKSDEAARLKADSDKCALESRNLYGSAFPNANVIKEFGNESVNSSI